MKRRRAGRPALLEGEAKDVVVALRFTGSEMAAIGAAAGQAGKSAAQWARAAILAAAAGLAKDP